MLIPLFEEGGIIQMTGTAIVEWNDEAELSDGKQAIATNIEDIVSAMLEKGRCIVV
jgi:hypothetical protein